jgi:hypothetical protein
MFLLVPFLFLFQENKVKMVMGLCFQRRRHDDGAFSPSPFFSSLSDVRLPPIAPRRLLRPLLYATATLSFPDGRDSDQLTSVDDGTGKQ